MTAESQKRLADSMIGTVHGRLRVVGRGESNKHRRAVYVCECTCGSVVNRTREFLRKSPEPSCGCAKLKGRPRKHGFSPRKTPPAIYGRWKGIIARCTDPNNRAYKWYGGKGITVCDAWRQFELFYADMGEPPFDKAEIDRIDPSKGYAPDNCRWIHKKENINRARQRR